MEYFQYDVLKVVSRFVTTQEWSKKDSSLIREETGLRFSAPSTHSAWRNYARIFKTCLLISERDGKAVPTPLAEILAQSGAVTCDEYLHFLVEATTDPLPALEGWKKVSLGQTIRHPLCFALKYILAKVVGLNDPITEIYEVIGAYLDSGFLGSEDSAAFLNLMPKRAGFAQIGRDADARQARESIKFISQISYLNCDGNNIITSLSQEDAMEIFQNLHPISGPYQKDGNFEIQRISKIFVDKSKHDFFEYKSTVVSDVLESGFTEGSKVKKTHILIERNAKLRSLFFDRTPTTVCDACSLDTKIKYPWVERVLDLHHILPLSSGTRVDSRTGTVLEDLVPICPACHRAIHRFYDGYLKALARKDFLNEKEARDIYLKAKGEINKGDFHVG